MKQLLTLLIALFGLGHAALAQIDTTGGRYRRPIFQQVNVQRAVPFGSAPNFAGTVVNLSMDIYEPIGDTVRRRPLIIFAHEGGFVTGNRNDQFMTRICTQMAQLGYVTASIDYRLLFFPLDSVGIGQAALRATQDMRAAVRFFRRDAATARLYRIHPSYIFAGGSSAGGFMALQTGYLDKPQEVPAYVNLQQLGGLEGNSGNSGYSSRVAGVINLSGAIGRLGWLEPGDVPLVSVHGTADATVPYGAGNVGGGLPPTRVYGSGAIKPRADAVGIRNELRTFRGAPHVPYNGSSASSMAYYDTTFQTVRDFIRPLLRQAGTVLNAASATATNEQLTVFPIPADELIRFEATSKEPFRPRLVELINANGQVVKRFLWDRPRMVIPRGDLKAGVYYLSGEGLQGRPLILK